MQSTTTHVNAVKPRKCQPSTPQAIVDSSQEGMCSHTKMRRFYTHTHRHTRTHAGRALKMDKGGNYVTNSVQWLDN